MKHSFLPLLIGLLCWTGSQAATRTYAYDGSKTQAENGTALQAAINAASSGDELKVQAGTYIGNFTMKDGVQVSGGWNSTFDAQTDYATILDANESGRVVNQEAAFSTLTIWSNLTIQNGKLTAALTGNLGAGVALNLKGQVKHCLIQNNTFTYSGDCIGGGVGEEATPSSNTEVMVDDCWIRNNKASHGGGVRIRGTVQNSIIENNLTELNAGGGVHLQAGRMVNCIIRSNTGKDCGGVRLYGKCDLINCLVYNNTASNAVGGVGIESALSNVIGNTIVNNNQLVGTGSTAGVKVTNTLSANGTFFVNNVVWGNMSNGTVESKQVYTISRYDKTAGQRSYNAIMGQKGDDSEETSIQLTADDPGFTNAASGDFSLLSTSVLLDRGYSAKATVSKDLAGNDRVVNSSVDIGAYEYPVVASNVYVLAGEDLQTKINNTASGYTVYVQAGTYYGNFTMKDGVNVSGGWNEDFTSQTDYATILDANESGRVVNQPAAFTTLTIWSNLTIQNGKLTSEAADKAGAGVVLFAKGQVKHCIIQNNKYTSASGTASGGGVYENGYTDAVLVDDCIIRNNTATHGGGVRICGVIKNSIIEGNSTEGRNAAGGVQLHYGGAMYNCIVRNNSAKGHGGVRLTGTKECTVANCLIVGNTATVENVGGLSINDGTHYVYNNTIVGNKQTSAGDDAARCGVLINVGNPAVFANNIVWGNKANDVVQSSQIQIGSSYLSSKSAYFINNAVVYSSVFGTNTILLTESPFADADYHLLPFSDLINSGNDAKSAGTTDLDGNPRKQGTIDRGCYERTMYSREVTSGNWGTICLPFDVAASDYAGAKVYKVVSFASDEKVGLLLDQVDGLEAGKPYFFQAESDAVKFGYVRTGDAAVAGNENGLYGTIEGETVSGEGYYVLQNNLLCPTYNAATGEDVEVTLGKNRAYLKFSEVPDFDGAAPSPKRRVIAIQQTENTATDIEDGMHQPRLADKVLRDGQILIIRDGKTYNVLGF